MCKKHIKNTITKIRTRFVLKATYVGNLQLIKQVYKTFLSDVHILKMLFIRKAA